MITFGVDGQKILDDIKRSMVSGELSMNSLALMMSEQIPHYSNVKFLMFNDPSTTERNDNVVNSADEMVNVVTRVMNTNKMVLVQDSVHDPLGHDFDSDVRARLVYPLLRSGDVRPKGAIDIQSEKPNVFSNWDKKFLKDLCKIIESDCQEK